MDIARPDREYVVKLDVFEGPLDLLLHLIRQHEIDIYDIPMAFITTKYLEYLGLMEDTNLDVGAEYLDMASYLTLLKSRVLLPTEQIDDDDGPEEGPDPREELVRRLLEYQKYKSAADDLADRPRLGRDSFPVGSAEDIEVSRDLAAPGLFALIEAFQRMVDGTPEEVIGEISVTRISISARIGELVDRLRQTKRMEFTALFEGNRTRSDLVVTFLALLEMTKIGLTKLYQAAAGSELYVEASEGLNEADQIVAQLPEEED